MAAKGKKTQGPKTLTPKEREHYEECVVKIQSFIDLWMQFYWTFRHAYEKQPFGMEDEQKFLRLKSEVARQHQFLYEMLTDEGKQDYVGGILATDLLRKIVNLSKMSQTSSENYYKIEKFWHQYTVNLHDSLERIRFKLKMDQEAQTS